MDIDIDGFFRRYPHGKPARLIPPVRPAQEARAIRKFVRDKLKVDLNLTDEEISELLEKQRDFLKHEPFADGRPNETYVPEDGTDQSPRIYGDLKRPTGLITCRQRSEDK